MIEIPAFNYRTVYFFIMSFFGIVFILSLMGMFDVRYPWLISMMSLINVFLGILAWIIDEKIEIDFELHKQRLLHSKEEIESKERKKFGNLIGVSVCTFLSAFMGLLFQHIS